MSKEVSIDVIKTKIFFIRGEKVMLDKDLAELYGVKPIVLRQQVKRNSARFPEDFMFQLTKDEVGQMVSQNVIPSWQVLGGYLPYAFTEQGVAMLAGVLRSKRAVEVNVAIMRAFVRLRQIFYAHKEFAHKLAELEGKVSKHDHAIKTIFEAIRQLLDPPENPHKEPIGFRLRK